MSNLLSSPAPPHDKRPIVISGPSGVGKGTLVQKLIDAHPNTFTFTVSHTTRKPRHGEVDGKAYFFVSESTFHELIAQNAFVEYAFFSGNYYGTSKKTIADQMAKGLVVVLDIEMQGVKQMKAEANESMDARYVFIKPPSFEDLERRLRGRGTEDDEDIRMRLVRARAEVEYAGTLGVHDKVIVNDELERAFRELEEFVYG
ncbi:guanylate kinase [Penicillium sp. DV-2018c]|nr:guanylate kinase [Penicillium sp. DV-2018c]KAJ5583607.1 guanylate kinase [Penicillium sp. DV-2018c]